VVVVVFNGENVFKALLRLDPFSSGPWKQF